MILSLEDATYYAAIIILWNFIVRLCMLQMNTSALDTGKETVKVCATYTVPKWPWFCVKMEADCSLQSGGLKEIKK